MSNPRYSDIDRILTFDEEAGSSAAVRNVGRGEGAICSLIVVSRRKNNREWEVFWARLQGLRAPVPQRI